MDAFITFPDQDSYIQQFHNSVGNYLNWQIVLATNEKEGEGHTHMLVMFNLGTPSIPTFPRLSEKGRLWVGGSSIGPINVTKWLN